MIARSKQYIANAKSRLEHADRLGRVRDALADLSAMEIDIVALVWEGTRRRHVARMAAAISWLGNGVIYLLLGLPILLLAPNAAPAVLTAGMGVLIAHLIYPWLKVACARERPFACNSDLQPLIKTLDTLSFPSGHMMTLTAASLPLLLMFPSYWPAGLLLWLVMGWSRIACAHHYPSDVLAGTTLGATIALPLSWAIL
ncbi:MAG: phosphatase PAP2 family protein [Sphingobium sp.]|nr:phosphatase PAP2 family protein [Sphingobium sp.]